MLGTGKVRNIGILAHVDAGKTTTTENLLYLSGRIRSVGKVDDGTAQTDWLDVERERGISVRAATTSFVWRGCRVNLIDTPGHVDFAAEVERSLRVLDGVVLVVSGAEGVQAHTETLWRAIATMGLPAIVFVNKMDRLGADAELVVDDIRATLSPKAHPVQLPRGLEETFEGSSDLLQSAPTCALAARWREQLVEALADTDECILSAYLAGEAISGDDIAPALRGAVATAGVYPILFGAAKKGLGIAELLDAVVTYLPPPSADPAGALAGVVFKVEHDESVGRLAYVRLYGGTLKVRDTVYIPNRQAHEKVAIIRRMNVRKHEDIQSLEAGDIGAIVGLGQARIGDIVGESLGVPELARICAPLLCVRVEARDPAHYARLVDALHELDDEDPLLGLEWVQETREMTLNVMGTVQVEILASLIASRFGVPVAFGDPSVIYRETPRAAGHGFVAYTMPKPCWAVLSFLIEPGACGSGLTYEARKIRAERMRPAYQNEVERRVPEALQQGRLGWEVTDLKVTLLDGEDHIFHTHPLDFAVATPMGIQDGLRNCGTRMLEPILAFRATVPEESGGRVMSDIAQMRGSFGAPEVARGRMVIAGEVPLATSMAYPTALSSLTKGRGSMSTLLACYRAAPEGTEAARPRRGVDPVDTAKYILWARKALGDRGRV